MATITVKNIPADLYERLKQTAELNRRSINREIIVCIEKAIYGRKADPEVLLSHARQLREKTADYLISDAEFTQAKQADRK